MKKFAWIAAVATAGLLYNRNQTRKVRVHEQIIPLDRAATPVRITQITDFHNHRHLDPKKVTEKIRAFDPVFIALTGDLISENSRSLAPALSFAKELVETGIPVLYVSGNHEWHHPKKESFYEQLEATGVIRLGGRTLEFPAVAVAGIDYPAAKHTLPKWPETALPRVLLAHSPSDIHRIDFETDLLLCGHTHGGQVRLPGIGAVIVPSEGFFAPVNKGLYQAADHLLYIDSGIGNTRLDLRTFNPIQFTNMIITAHR